MTSADWQAFHLYYHGDRSLLLRRVVRPLVHGWLAAGRIDRFFFVRYPLGGPHVRLRVRPAGSDAADAVRRELTRAADAFFAGHPSETVVPEEKIRQQTKALVTSDTTEDDETVYPDTAVREVPFIPEIDRYGGEEHLQSSLDFFMVSSTVALDFLDRYGDQPWSRQLPQVLRLLIAQAKGLAHEDAETRSFLAYGLAGWGERMPPIAERGDQAYEKQPQVFQQLLQATPAVLSDSALDLLHEGARRLCDQVDRAEPPVRWRILWSQMHMTANRMGLKNPEEVYLSRILERTGQDLEDVGPAAEPEPADEPWTGRVLRLLGRD